MHAAHPSSHPDHALKPHLLAYAVAVEVELVLDKVGKVGVDLQEALERLQQQGVIGEGDCAHDNRSNRPWSTVARWEATCKPVAAIQWLGRSTNFSARSGKHICEAPATPDVLCSLSLTRVDVGKHSNSCKVHCSCSTYPAIVLACQEGPPAVDLIPHGLHDQQ